MSGRDRLLASLVAVLWGLNFLAIRVGLDYFPPFFLAALRYLVLVVPVVLLVPRPDVPWRWLLAYGMTFGAAHFGLLFLAIEVGMPTGLASVVQQASAPFTVLLGALLLSERPSARQIGGVGLAVLGLVVIAVDRAQVATLLPMLLTVLAGLAGALGQISSRLARPKQPLQFALWISIVPPLPLLALSALMEGPTAGWTALGASLTPQAWPGLLALAYITIIGTVVGAGIWTALLNRNPAHTVAPFTMLMPVVGIGGAWAFLRETPTVSSLVGSAVVVAGVVAGSTRSPKATRMPAQTTPEPPRETPDPDAVKN